MTSNKRRRIVTSSSLPSLSEDMIMDVLLRLPVKSILRFRVVCRAWVAMLSSEEFIDRHMVKADADAASAPPKLLFISPTTKFVSNAVYLLSPSVPCADLLFSLDEVRGDYVDPVPLPCRGLTLVYDHVEPAYYVCNAATRAFTKLPPCLEVWKSTAGLGFDTRTKEYKVVRLFQGPGSENKTVGCQVYTLGGEYGDCWRPAAGGVPFRFCRAALSAISNARMNKIPPVLAQGFLHWLIGPSFLVKRPRAAILSFSVTDETFAWVRSPPFMASFMASGVPLVELPPPFLATGAHLAVELLPPFMASKMHLVELDDHLCMVRDLRYYSFDGSMEIWKLQDYNSSVWSLEHRINLSGHMARDLLEPQVVRVLGCIGIRESGKNIIIATSEHKVHIYDPMSETIETIPSVRETRMGYQTKRSAFRVNLFKESLAPVYRTNEEIALSVPMAKAVKEILLRLPARVVVQLKLVCKLWRRLIECKSFIHSYSLHWNIDKRPKVMLVSKGIGDSCFKFAPLQQWHWESHGQGAGLDTKVVCSKPCHGLNLISTATKNYVYNPCTGFHMTYSYQGSSIGTPWEMPSDGCRQDNLFAICSKNCGLGFNTLTQDYVLVQIIYEWKDFESRGYSLTCSIFNCSRKSVQVLPWPPLPVNEMPPAYLAGTLYWMSEPRLGPSYEWTIVAFNIAKQVFDIIPCPLCIVKWSKISHENVYVVELGGLLCAVLANAVSDTLHIWKLELDRWDRAYAICLKAWPDYSIQTNVVVPLAIDPNDGRILLNTGRRIGFYDPTDQTIEDLYALDQMPFLSGMKHMSHLEVSQGFHITKCQQFNKRVSRWDKSPCEQYEQYVQPSITFSENKLPCPMPLVPMLYEESLACCSQVGKLRWLSDTSNCS